MIDAEILGLLGAHDGWSRWHGDEFFVALRRYDLTVRAKISRATLENCARPEEELWRVLWNLAKHFRGAPIINHDPGDEDRR